MLIRKRKHYRGKYGDPGVSLAPKAIGPFTIVEKMAENCYRLDIPEHIRGRAYPVFHSSNLIPYETRVLNPLACYRMDGKVVKKLEADLPRRMETHMVETAEKTIAWEDQCLRNVPNRNMEPVRKPKSETEYQRNKLVTEVRKKLMWKK